jgi:hypothetical protein
MLSPRNMAERESQLRDQKKREERNEEGKGGWVCERERGDNRKATRERMKKKEGRTSEEVCGGIKKGEKQRRNKPCISWSAPQITVISRS